MRIAVDNDDGLNFDARPLHERIREEAAPVVHLRPLAAEAFEWQDPKTLPPRPWLIGVRALLGFSTAIVAPGGLGKTTYAIGLALSVAAGQPLMGERVWQPGPVWVWNLEDGRDELVKRVSAAILHFRRDPAKLHPIYLNSGRDRALCLAASTVERGDDGATITHIVHPDEEALTSEARTRGIKMIVVDPFVSSHALNENSNPDMASAMQAWSRVAAGAGCAVILVHHTRKGATGGNIEDSRGGSAIANAARVGLTLARMGDEEGERFDIPERERWRYVRVDDAKANLAPRAERATWIRLASVDLGNATAEYPAGDSVQVAEPWTPPDVFEDVTPAVANRILDLIAEGPRAGTLYTLHRRNASDRWAGNVVIEVLDVNEAQASQILATWLKNNVIEEIEYKDEEQRKTRKGLRVLDHNRPTETA